MNRRDFEDHEAEVSGSDGESDDDIIGETAADRAFVDDDTQFPEDQFSSSFYRMVNEHMEKETEKGISDEDSEDFDATQAEEGAAMELDEVQEVHEGASQHVAPERDAMLQLTRRLSRRQPVPATQRPRRIYIDPFWKPPEPEFSPDAAEHIKRFCETEGINWQTDMYPDFYRLYEEKAREDYSRIQEIPKEERIWKKSPWKERIGTGPWTKDSKIPWLLHKFIPYGYEFNARKDPCDFIQFDAVIAMVQYKSLFVHEADRSPEVIAFH